MDIILAIVAALVPPSAILGATIHASRRWTGGWRLTLIIPAVLSVGAIATIAFAPFTEGEAGGFLVLLAYLSFLFASAFSGAVVMLIHAARGAARPRAADASPMPANEEL